VYNSLGAGKQEEEAIMEGIGERVRYHRGQAGLTQEMLAGKAGISTAALVRLEGGEVRRPQAGTLTKLAVALGVDPASLREGAAPSAPLEVSGAGTFTAIYELTDDGWWVVSVPEIPGAHSQGESLEEAREMIRDAVRMLLEVRREDAERETEGKKNVVREPLEV
jgi:predicted RNase H-like HicB family nuclease/DNA-binding Xre family transcriptional regulator